MILTAATCLALTLYHEARGEADMDAQLAVAEVVLNRVDHPSYPDTVCGVMADDRGPKSYDCQFSFYCDGKSDEPHNAAAWDRSLAVAQSALSGDVLGIGATHYHTVATSPSWAARLTAVGIVGTHIFYTDGRCMLPSCSRVPKMRP